MPKNKRILIGLAFLVILLVLGVASNVLALPSGLQSFFYSALFKLTGAANNESTLNQLHKATKVRKQTPSGKTYYTYKYSSGDANIIKRDSAKCMACHGNMLQRDANNHPKNPIHYKMLTAAMLNFSCTDCHKDVQTNKRTPAHPTFRVDRELCLKCHDPSSTSPPAQSTGGLTWAPEGVPRMPSVFRKHGINKEDGKQWIIQHPRYAMAIGIDECRKCHKVGSELDICRTCHLRGGFRPSSHRVTYKARINQIYPDSKRNDVVTTSWKGYHFVLAREALAKLGTKVTSPRNLPLDKVQKLPCGACHVIKEWCTKCHIKHNPNWLNPNVGHPSKVDQFGTKYCARCHDPLGTKCVSCHSFVGTLR